MFVLVALYRSCGLSNGKSASLVEGVIGTPVSSLDQAQQQARLVLADPTNSFKFVRIRIKPFKKVKAGRRKDY